MVVYIDEKTMEQICHRLAVEFFDKDDEPISPFITANKQSLKSALGLPSATFDHMELYPSFERKGAVLLYSLIKNHPFPNGNKRIATATFLVFLYINGFWLEKKTDELTSVAIRIAESKSLERDVIVQELSHFMTENLKKL